MKILHFIYGLNIGGAESFINNLISNSPLDFEFHFAIQNPQIINQHIKSYIESRDYNSVHLLPSFFNNPFRHLYDLKKLLKNLDFDCIHIHNNAIINPSPLIVKKPKNIKVILHSHNSSNASGGRLANLIHKINRSLFLKNKFIKIACSQKAGEWMFKKKDFETLNNAIELQKFKFSNFERENVRKSYNVRPDTVLIGSVGRLVTQKNYPKLIEIFAEFYKIHKNSKLLIVGDGPLKESLYARVNELNLQNLVIFTGAQNETSSFYSAFDCFLMPSLYEGLNFTAIEAQASGLPIIASSTVTSEINVSGDVQFLPVEATSYYWVKAIENQLSLYRIKDRNEASNKLVGSRFDLSVTINKMLSIYQI